LLPSIKNATSDQKRAQEFSRKKAQKTQEEMGYRLKARSKADYEAPLDVVSDFISAPCFGLSLFLRLLCLFVARKNSKIDAN